MFSNQQMNFSYLAAQKTGIDRILLAKAVNTEPTVGRVVTNAFFLSSAIVVWACGIMLLAVGANVKIRDRPRSKSRRWRQGDESRFLNTHQTCKGICWCCRVVSKWLLLLACTAICTTRAGGGACVCEEPHD